MIGDVDVPEKLPKAGEQSDRKEAPTELRPLLLGELVGTYYKTSLDDARIGGKAQPAKVDQRAQTDFILNRVDSVMAMGYIKKKPGKDAIDWSLLEQAIAEVPDVYAKLKYKSA